MSWLSTWIKKKWEEKKEEGFTFSKKWDKVDINGFLMSVARFFGRGTLFICNSCKWEWNVYGEIKHVNNGDWVKLSKHNQHIGYLIHCPNCKRSYVRPKR